MITIPPSPPAKSLVACILIIKKLSLSRRLPTFFKASNDAAPSITFDNLYKKYVTV
jgi:hypothetical protein